MSGEMILFVGRQTLETGLLMIAPVLIVAMAMGLLVGIFQAVTSIRDMTLNMAIKIAVVAITILICGGWMMQLALGFTQDIFEMAQAVTQ